MLDLVVEASHHPAEDSVARAEVDRRLDLVHRPDPSLRGELLGGGEVGLLDAVCELEGHGHDQADDHRVDEIAADDSPPRIDEHRHDDHPADEDHLPAQETGEIPTARHTQRARADTPASEGGDIADCLPAERHQAVQRPDVVVLQPVPGTGSLFRHQPCERHLRDVGVVAVHVRIRVMGDVVLHAPGIAREPEQRIGGPAHQMVQAACPKVRAVIGVVHHAERNQRRPERSARRSRADRATGWGGRERESARSRTAPGTRRRLWHTAPHDRVRGYEGRTGTRRPPDASAG